VANYDTASYPDENMRKDNEFKGKLDGLNSNGDVRLRFSGSWLRTNEKPAPFSLQQFRIDLGGLKLDEKKEESANKKLRYEIETAAPQLTGAGAARVEKFNRAIANLVAASVSEFKKYAAQPREGPGSDQDFTLGISYEMINANKDFISVLFSFHSYSGGAHPNTKTMSFNYDLNRSVALKLADLFTPNSNYLKVISDYCVNELKKLERASWAEDGAGPKMENFHSWNITPVGLKITFDPYQVGSYVDGEYVVVVPHSLLTPIIKSDSVLARFTK
jgi:Protein of unknown function (DUF3298)/Deacetylase PdaC